MDSIRRVDSSGTVLVRDSFVLAFFCCRDFPTMAEGVKAVFDTFLAAVPGDALQWAIVGSSASEIKPIGKTTLARCRSMFDAKKAAKRPMTAFKLFGPESDNSSYRFELNGKSDVEKDKTINAETNMVEMRFPVEYLQKKGSDALLQLAITCARSLPYDSGYGSLALSYSKQGAAREIVDNLVPLAIRHPGFDVHDNSSTRVALGRRSRGARWLTFLGSELVQELGGEKALRSKLDSSVQVLETGNGLALRAGVEPLLGDVNRRVEVASLRSVARAIEPVTAFGDVFLRPLFHSDPDKLERWERRFLS